MYLINGKLGGFFFSTTISNIFQWYFFALCDLVGIHFLQFKIRSVKVF